MSSIIETVPSMCKGLHIETVDDRSHLKLLLLQGYFGALPNHIGSSWELRSVLNLFVILKLSELSKFVFWVRV